MSHPDSKPFNFLDYVGKKYRLGGRGPDEFDCWGVITSAYRDYLGIELPNHLEVSAAGLATAHSKIEEGRHEKDWLEVTESPQAFDVVALGKDLSSGVVHHVGLWLPDEGGIVVHAERPRVVSESAVKLIRRFPFNKIYRYDGPSC